MTNKADNIHLTSNIFIILHCPVCNRVRQIVNGLCKTGDTSTAILLLRIMEEDRTVDDALKRFSEINEKIIDPNVVTYTTLICGLCKFGKWNEATRMLIEIFLPMFSVLWMHVARKDGLCKTRLIGEASSLVQMMERNGLYLDVFMYSILIDALCKDKKLYTARDLFNQLSAKGLHHDDTRMVACEMRSLTTPSSEDFLANARGYGALLLLEEMTGKGFSTDASISSLIVDQILTKGQDPAIQEKDIRYKLLAATLNGLILM
ncbi:pentatricopeptide repeat-containing protein At1g62914, mitochondrial-like [Actinidia eriantha]|uniref:pentatricopeptide repeat-containing protein At1g62914, mitochondrial-like n=1 Tax=Actinidia eriantha TaxID=165200 RepID=UPI00258535A1|nr:pentatricopeptide repeat-containing protein At1g62914, mitochondrial-like [Actinidia eriantha]